MDQQPAFKPASDTKKFAAAVSNVNAKVNAFSLTTLQPLTNENSGFKPAGAMLIKS